MLGGATLIWAKARRICLLHELCHWAGWPRILANILVGGGRGWGGWGGFTAHQSPSSGRGSLPHMFKSEIWTGRERWRRLALLCSQIDGTYHLVRFELPDGGKISGLLPLGERRIGTVGRNRSPDVKKSVRVRVTACPSLTDSCAPCVPLSTSRYCLRQCTPSAPKPRSNLTWCSKHSGRFECPAEMYIKWFSRAAGVVNGFMHSWQNTSKSFRKLSTVVMDGSLRNVFNAVLSAVLTNQSRDSRWLHKRSTCWVNLPRCLCTLEAAAWSLFTDSKKNRWPLCALNPARSVSSIIWRKPLVYFRWRMALCFSKQALNSSSLHHFLPLTSKVNPTETQKLKLFFQRDPHHVIVGHNRVQ